METFKELYFSIFFSIKFNFKIFYLRMNHSNDVIVNSITNFSLNCLKQLKKDNEPTIFSPISLILALGMAYAGTKGETKKEFLEIIKSNNENNEIDKYFSEFIQALDEIPPDTNLGIKTANKIYIHSNFHVLESYKKLLSTFYDGQFESINFNENVIAAEKINAFISDATNEKIKDLITSDAINSMTRILLVNCLHFKGDWRKRFKEYEMYDDFFYRNENSREEVTFMKKQGFLTYNENENSQLVLLDYCDDKSKFGILLPKKRYDISNILNSLNGEELLKLINGASGQDVDLTIPKFKAESNFYLNDCLKSLGLKLAFSHDADFSGITESEKLFISNVVQKVFIDVNENGTEAAAATAMMIECLMLPIPPENPIVFKADHPFLFFILYDNKHMLFNGIYM
uniref:SERPIN domain-containing protein n=1 Tax=Strongyloides stercoralis TaxID=6248 RepID=A0A0K0E114_STRER